MIQFFEQLAELLRQALAYLELDEGYEPEAIESVEVEINGKGNCIVTFPDILVRYFASNWNDERADWLFSR